MEGYPAVHHDAELIEHMSALHVRPGDVLVVQLPGLTSERERELIGEMLKRVKAAAGIDDGTPVVVLENGARLGVIRPPPEELAPQPAAQQGEEPVGEPGLRFACGCISTATRRVKVCAKHANADDSDALAAPPP